MSDRQGAPTEDLSDPKISADMSALVPVGQDIVGSHPQSNHAPSKLSSMSDATHAADAQNATRAEGHAVHFGQTSTLARSSTPHQPTHITNGGKDAQLGVPPITHAEGQSIRTSNSSLSSHDYVHEIRAIHYEAEESETCLLTVLRDSGTRLRKASTIFNTTIHALILYSTLVEFLPERLGDLQLFSNDDPVHVRIKWKLYKWLEKLGRKLIRSFADPRYNVAGPETTAIGLIELGFLASRRDLRLPVGESWFPRRAWRMTCLVVRDLGYNLVIGDLGLKYLKSLRKGEQSRLVESATTKYYPKHQPAPDADRVKQMAEQKEAEERRKRILALMQSKISGTGSTNVAHGGTER